MTRISKSNYHTLGFMGRSLSVSLQITWGNSFQAAGKAYIYHFGIHGLCVHIYIYIKHKYKYLADTKLPRLWKKKNKVA